MSDYLFNLAARSLGLIEVLQPRIASIFEPPSDVGAMVVDHPSGGMERTPGEPVLAESLSVTSQTTDPHITAQSRSRPLTAGMPSLEPVAGRVREQPISGDQQAAVDDVQQRHAYRSTLPGENQVAITPVREDLSSAPEPGPSQSGVDRPRQPLEATPALTRAIAPYEAVTAPLRNPRKQEGEPRVEPGIRRIAGLPVTRIEALSPAAAGRTETASAETPSIRAMQSSPHATVVAHVPAGRQAAVASESIGLEPSPTIRITIGRVDVRAIMPQPPPPASAPKRARPLSLEEYLKQREGGKR